MNTVLQFFLTWLSWWAFLTAAEASLILGVGTLLDARTRRRRHQAELRRINDQAIASVQRIGQAFIVAQRQLRDEAARSRRGHQ